MDLLRMIKDGVLIRSGRSPGEINRLLDGDGGWVTWHSLYSQLWNMDQTNDRTFFTSNLQISYLLTCLLVTLVEEK